MMRGPSPYAVRVLRSILRKGRTVAQIEAETGLARRTVLAQVDALRKADAVRVAGRIGQQRQAGAFAVYQAVVEAV